MAFTVTFHPLGRSVEISDEMELHDIAELAGVDLRFPCGSKGTCGKCKVIFEAGTTEPTATELDRLSDSELAQGYRLACQTRVAGDAVIYIPDGQKSAKILTVGTSRKVAVKPAITKRHVKVAKPSVEDLRSDLTRVLDAFDIPNGHSWTDLPTLRHLAGNVREAGFEVTGVLANGAPLAWEPGDTTQHCYGAAFDIGTTTLAAYLIDLNTGHQVAVASAMNPQARVGDDVISRISYVMQNDDGLCRLQSAVIDELNKLLETLTATAGVSSESVYEATIVGNTCMTHLLMGVDPCHLAQSPYVPVVSQSVYLKACDIGLAISPHGRIHVMPCIAGYVGADTVGVVLSTAMYQKDEMVLAVDIGTNGEIVLGSKARMVACSTAAGPAFEGAHIAHGMRAAPGAIDAVWFGDSRELKFSTVGGERATGICGSGLLDAIIFMVQAGIVEAGGRIVDAEEVSDDYAHLRDRLREGERGNEFVLVAADETSIEGPVVITQRDVREVQLAKGAIAAGIHSLMDRLNVGLDDLDHVVLAGAFGNYVRKESAIAAGMLPDVPLSKVKSVGNAAGEGSKLALISLDARGDADRIANSVEYVELTTDFGFQERFADALMFGDMDQV